MKIINIKRVRNNFAYLNKIAEKHNKKKILEFTGWSEDEFKKECYEYIQEIRASVLR